MQDTPDSSVPSVDGKRPAALVRITDDIVIGPGQPLALLSGPCVIEDDDLMMRVAETMVGITRRLEIPYVVIMGGDEAERGVVTLKQMDEGRDKSADVADHEEWKAARFGQQEIPRGELTATLKRLLGD